jgi:hypothetical protein
MYGWISTFTVRLFLDLIKDSWIRETDPRLRAYIMPVVRSALVFYDDVQTLTTKTSANQNIDN